MNLYNSLKHLWKNFNIKGSVKNYSNQDLWVLETDSENGPFARILYPGHKTPKEIDCDAFKRKDGKNIQGHKNWWKIYDFSTAEIYTDKEDLTVSVIKKTAVSENHFGNGVKYISEKWGEPLILILDVKKYQNNRIRSYLVSGHGWLDFKTTFQMTCAHEIDNARPVFPKTKRPYIRSKKDSFIFNNFSKREKS